MKKEEKGISIEEGLTRLDEILTKMEEKDTDLSESFALYEEGMKLIKGVNEEIDTVEKKVMMLKSDGEIVEFEVEE